MRDAFSAIAERVVNFLRRYKLVIIYILRNIVFFVNVVLKRIC